MFTSDKSADSQENVDRVKLVSSLDASVDSIPASIIEFHDWRRFEYYVKWFIYNIGHCFIGRAVLL